MSDPTNNILPIDTRLNNGQLRVVRHLGSGGFGNTYLTEDINTGERFAVKEFYMKGINERDEMMTVSVSNPENKATFTTQQNKFRKEAMRMLKLECRNIVRVYAQFDENSTSYYVMEYIDGCSLTEYIKKNGRPLGESEAMDIYIQLLNALEAMHAINLWHLDVKPSNIMMENTGRAVLIDFGASKQTSLSTDATVNTSTTNNLNFTPPYAPIEQVMQSLSSVGPWSDIYALGATLFYMLTRHQAPKPDELNRANSFRDLDSASEQVRQLVKWSMQYERSNRPQSVEQVRLFLRTGVQPVQETEPETYEDELEDGYGDALFTDTTDTEDSRLYDEQQPFYNDDNVPSLQFSKGQFDFQSSDDELAFNKRISTGYTSQSPKTQTQISFQTNTVVAIVVVVCVIMLAVIAIIIF